MYETKQTRKYKNYTETKTNYKLIGRAHIEYKFNNPLAMARKLANIIKAFGLNNKLKSDKVACYAFFNNLTISLHIGE